MRRFGFLFLLLAVILHATWAQAQVSERAKTFMAIKSLLGQGDTFLSIEYLNGLSDSLTTAQKYQWLIEDFDSNNEPIHRIVAFSRAGIQFCIDRSKLNKSIDPKISARLNGFAMSLAHTAAGICFEGRPGNKRVFSDSDRQAGLDLALMDLRLAKQNKAPAKIVGQAQWLVGAQTLSSKRFMEAAVSFEECEKSSIKAQNPMLTLLAQGSKAVASIAAGNGNENDESVLAESISDLSQSDDPTAKEYAAILKSIAGLWAGRSAK